eukprot:TRINITY_DN54902_c0_g1_i1.p1 TRINITY_DN54902_c0_g1~~TRINITY_DN54902_c0_g1_i1.p1  ORF type:complete len:678 (-),score=90.56 TRINITY_DN54902_c0_g1_i1:65-2053(-)
MEGFFRQLCTKVLEELGGVNGHAELLASGHVFLRDWAALGNVEGFVRQALNHHAVDLARIPDDIQRLHHLSRWLRSSILRPLLQHLLVGAPCTLDMDAARLATEWEASGFTFYNGLARVRAALAPGQPAPSSSACVLRGLAASQPAETSGSLATGRRIVRAKRRAPAAAAEALKGILPGSASDTSGLVTGSGGSATSQQSGFCPSREPAITQHSSGAAAVTPRPSIAFAMPAQAMAAPEIRPQVAPHASAFAAVLPKGKRTVAPATPQSGRNSPPGATSGSASANGIPTTQQRTGHRPSSAFVATTPTSLGSSAGARKVRRVEASMTHTAAPDNRESGESFEEIRLKDYIAGRRFGNANTNQIANATPSRLTDVQRTRNEEAQITKLLAEQGWALRLIDNSTKSTFQKMLSLADPRRLGKGRDVKAYGRNYSRLDVMFAWQIIAHDRRKAFEMQRDALTRDCARAERQGISVPTVRSRLNVIGETLQGHDPMQANEGWFLHGTKPETVLPILSGGLSERMCSGMFGKGVYLAEDPEKSDQYASPDSEYCAPGLENLHKRLYRLGSGTRHPCEDLFYVFVVRAAAGLSLRTKDGTSNMDRPSEPVFASDEKRELSEVRGVTPPLRFHSLLVELGGRISRFREFVHFNSARFSVEYLIVYRRVS